MLQVQSFPDMPASWLVHWLTNVHDRGISYTSMSGYEAWWREEFQRDAILLALPKDVGVIVTPCNIEGTSRNIGLRCSLPFRSYVASVSPPNTDKQGSRYILFVSDADEVASPALLHDIFSDRVALYNRLHLRAAGLVYLRMDTLVYGFRYSLGETDTCSFLTTDRMIRAMQRAHGHLVTLTAIRTQVRANNPVQATHAALFKL